MENAATSAETGKPAKNPSRAAYFREYRRRKKERDLAAASIAEKIHIPDGEITPATVAETIEWIETTLKVPSGPLAGRPFIVPDWQAEWLTEAMKPGVQEAGLSISRKNGKSGIIAAWLGAALVGPINIPGWRGIVTSLTGSLARELRDAVTQTLDASGFYGRYKLHKSPPPGRIFGLRGARLDFLAADRASGHALGADLAIIDEAGLLREESRDLWNAVYSAISGRNGKFWGISIQGDGPMFAEMEQRTGAPGIHFRKWAAPDDADIFSEDAWRAGNPALVDSIKSIAYMRAAAERAKRSPGNEMHFRAYDLNQPVDPARETIVAVSEYAACIAPDAPEIGGDIVLGIDLGGTISMTAAVALSPATGAIKVYGAFGDDPPLSERARTDRMGSLYDRMVRGGELKLYPGQVTPVVPFLADVLADVGARGRLCAIGLDRYRKAEARKAFNEAGLPNLPTFWRGVGAGATADGSHDVRAFQRLVRDGTLKTRGSLMLETAIANSYVDYDSRGNPALNRAKANARYDALQAGVIAAGVAALMEPAPLLGGSGIHVV